MRKDVLVVDDDPLIQAVSRRALTRAGFDAVVVGSLNQARSRIATRRFDVAILDYFLRHRDCGCDLIAPLRESNPAIRIVVMSGLGAVAEIIHHANQAGADLVVPKAHADWPALARGEHLPPTPARPALSLANLRREIIEGALLVHRGNISATARALGIERSTLQRALRRAHRSPRDPDEK